MRKILETEYRRNGWEARLENRNAVLFEFEIQKYLNPQMSHYEYGPGPKKYITMFIDQKT